jgi:hypothetical protein
MRVFPNKDGSELIFTLYQRPGMSDRDFRNDEKQIKADLEKLKALILEEGQGITSGCEFQWNR